MVLHARKPLGYDASAVDDLLARVASERTPLGQQARWSRTRGGRGYDIDPDAARPADSDAAGTSGARCVHRVSAGHGEGLRRTRGEAAGTQPGSSSAELTSDAGVALARTELRLR